MPLKYTLCLLSFVIIAALLPSAHAQIEMQVDHKGEYSKVVAITGTRFFVENKKGRRVKADFEKTRFRSADDYAAGIVEVNFGDSRDPRTLRNNTMKAGKNSFEMELDLVSDRTLKDCFYVLLFNSNGAMATFFDSVGSLQKGKTKSLKIKMPAQVTAIGSLHIFEQGSEVRTNDSVAGRSLDDEFKTLLSGSTVAPAIELFREVHNFPHKLTPSGRLLATFRDDKTHQRLIVIDTTSMQIIRSVDIGEYGEEISDPEWLNEKTLLYIFEEELHSLDIDSGKTRKLHEPVDSISRILNDGIHAVVYRSSDSRYDKRESFTTIDCISDTIKNVEIAMKRDINYIDHDGEFRLKWEYEHTVISYKVRPQLKAGWKDLDSLNHEEGLSFSNSARDAIDQEVHVVGFSGDNKSILISSNRNRDTYGLYEYSLEQGRISSTIWEDPRFDLGGDSYTPIRILADSKGNRLGIQYWRDRQFVKWFDPRFQAIQDGIEAALPNLQHVPHSWADDASTIVFFSHSEANRGSYYLFQTSEMKLRKLYDVNPALSEYELGSTQARFITARDGTEILCYLTLPPNWDGKPIPTLANIHGGPVVRDRLEFSPINQFYATRGFAVLEVNYRGSAGFGRKHKLDGIIGNLDTTPINDIADCVTALVDEGVADPEKLAVIGASWGGYSVYMSLIRYPELFKCGVAVAAPSKIGEMLQFDYLVGNRYGRAFWDELINRVSDDPHYEERISPINHVDRITKPLLILQGELDSRVSKGQADAMAGALKKAGKDFSLIYYPDDGHGHGEFGWNHHLNETEAFIRKNLGL